MDRRALALDRLRSYNTMCVAAENLRGQIKLLKLHQERLHAVRTDRVVVCGQADGREDKLLDNILHRQELEASLESTLQWIHITQRALGVLENEELMILRKLYIQERPGTIAQLCQLLMVEKSSIYRKRDKALEKFTMALFGAESKKPIGG